MASLTLKNLRFIRGDDTVIRGFGGKEAETLSRIIGDLLFESEIGQVKIGSFADEATGISAGIEYDLEVGK